MMTTLDMPEVSSGMPVLSSLTTVTAALRFASEA